MPTFVRTQEIEHQIGARGRFALRVTSPDVELRSVEGEAARVHVGFEIRAGSDAEADEIFARARLDVHRGEGYLEVTEPKRNEGLGTLVRIFGIGHAGTAAAITAEVPAGAEVVYNGVSADLTATGFRGEQQYQTVSGDLVLDRLAGTVQLRGVSGDVSLRADGPIRLDASTVSGDVSAFAPHFEDLRIVTVSGDVETEGELGLGQEHRVETVSGDLSMGVLGGLTLEVRGLSTDALVSLPHRSEGSRDRRRYVIGDGDAHLVFSSMSGDVVARQSRRFAAPTAPVPPVPPASPAPPGPAAAATSAHEELEILRALERGEIDVEEASARLAGRKADA